MQTFEWPKTCDVDDWAENSVIFQHNSDLSGKVTISKPSKPGVPDIEVEGRAILAFVVDFVRKQRIDALEQAEDHEIIGLEEVYVR